MEQIGDFKRITPNSRLNHYDVHSRNVSGNLTSYGFTIELKMDYEKTINGIRSSFAAKVAAAKAAQ